MKTLKNFEKSLTKPKKGRGKSHSAEKLEGGPFWVLHFKVEAFECVQNQVLSTFGKSEYFTSGTYAMSEKSDEKKLATVIVGLFSLEKRRLKKKKTSHSNSRALFTRKTPTKNLRQADSFKYSQGYLVRKFS